MIDIELINFFEAGIFSNPIFHPLKPQTIDLELFAVLLKSLSPTLSPFSFLITLEHNEQIKPFRLGTLNDCKGDLSKRWYISFWVWDGLKNKMVRKRLYEVNKFLTTVERYAYAKRYIEGLDKRLKAGMYLNNPNALDNTKENIKSYHVFEALDYILKIVKDSNRHATYLSYKSDIKIFKEFLKENNKNTLYINQINTPTIYLFIDYLVIEKKVTNVTINNKIATLKSVFNKLKQRGLIEKNPVTTKKLKEQLTPKNLAFNKDQLKILKEVIKTKEPYLWLFIQFIYYTYTRPTEIMRLKVGNIDFKKGLITIEASQSKNQKTGFINIPLALLKALKDYDLQSYNASNFIFTATKRPGVKKISKNYMNSRHQTIIKNLGFKNDFTLYSWKHTGVVNAYKSGIDIKSIQLQCRHSSIEQTDRYLKSLGFGDNTEILKIPEL